MISDNYFSQPLSLRLRLGPDQAMDVEAGVRPGENALGPFRAHQLLAYKHRQNLAGKDLGETRVVDPLDMTRWAESPGAARKHDEPLLGAVGTPDAGEPAAGIAAVKILLDHLLDDRPE